MLQKGGEYVKGVGKIPCARRKSRFSLGPQMTKFFPVLFESGCVSSRRLRQRDPLSWGGGFLGVGVTFLVRETG
jgi:hypothetical protein